MGHQIQLFLLPDDVKEIEEALLAEFGAVLVAISSPEPPPVVLASSVKQFKLAEGAHPDLDGAWYARALITQPHRLGDIKYVLAKTGWWMSLPFDRPAIELSAGRWQNLELAKGRLWYDDVDAAFSKWARSVLRFVQKRAIRVNKVGPFWRYAGRHAIDWQMRAGGAFVDV